MRGVRRFGDDGEAPCGREGRHLLGPVLRAEWIPLAAHDEERRSQRRELRLQGVSKCLPRHPQGARRPRLEVIADGKPDEPRRLPGRVYGQPRDL